MRRLTMVVCFVVIPLLWNASSVSAQFFEAGVQKLEPPINAPDFALKELGGREVSLNAFRGKVVLLNFFSPSCSVCQKQASSFDKLDEVIKSKDMVFLTVAFEGKEKELWEYKKKFSISMPILIDDNGSIAKAYNVRGHHETFFISRGGKIVGKTYAEKNWTSASMKKLIQYLLKQK
jgi:peroxiredoxin